MADLRRIYTSEDDIPEPYRDLYIENDGKFILDVEDDEGRKSAEDVRKAISARDNEKKKVAELQKKLNELQEKLGDVEPDRLGDAAEALKRIDELEHQKLLDEKKFEEAAEKKYQRQLTEAQRQVETLKQSLQEHESKYSDLMNMHRSVRINDSLRSAFLEQGGNPKMLPFILATEAQKWELGEDFEPTPVDMIDGGKTKVTALGADGNPLTMAEHARTFLRENSWAALDSHGSDSRHQTNGNANGFTVKESEIRNNHAKYVQVRERAQKAGVPIEDVIVPG